MGMISSCRYVDRWKDFIYSKKKEFYKDMQKTETFASVF